MATYAKDTRNNKFLAQDWVEAHETLGHIFLYIDGLGAIHLIPKGWVVTRKEKIFRNKHADAINQFLRERE